MSPTIRCICLCALVKVMCLGCASAPTVPAAPSAPAPPLKTGEATIIMGQQKCCPKQTLPEFLGITGMFKAVGGLLGRARNVLGMYYPGLESKPGVRAIADPANLDSPNPAAAAAAEIKAEQDGAAQKIKALRYLAEIGCGGCYPDVEKAFLASLEDCTEEVRYEGVQALRKAAGNPCQFCRHDSCCSPEIIKKLREIGCGIDEKTCCYKEPSARVRRVARLALGLCPPPRPDVEALPQEGPSEADRPADAPMPAANEGNPEGTAAQE